MVPWMNHHLYLPRPANSPSFPYLIFYAPIHSRNHLFPWFILGGKHMVKLVPRKFFLTKGIGKSNFRLVAFENALRAAKIERYNLVCVSSILPPACIEIPVDDGNAELEAGQIVHCVMSKFESNARGEKIAASIGIAKPGMDVHGYIAEHHVQGNSSENSDVEAQEMAAIMLATSMGLEFDETGPFSDLKKEFLDKKNILEIKSCTARSAVKEGWTCVLAAAVFVCE
ncbi:arginine decarboxylase, pyruvoyl-dependent [Candidatus Bathyarchaeota archaeon]|nr:arginine decarboxylase, pyruvoyl-dependent [Candidatus Bathyarchaeota archaeon]